MELKIRDWNAVKFRAYDEINKEMVYPRIIKESFSAISNGDLLNRYEIVMQYTGLNDRNNKQILLSKLCLPSKQNRKELWQRKVFQEV